MFEELHIPREPLLVMEAARMHRRLVEVLLQRFLRQEPLVATRTGMVCVDSTLVLKQLSEILERDPAH